MSAPALVWFRQDLRLADNPALQAALARGGSVVPVYVHAPQEEGEWAPGAASRWWLHASLQTLAAALDRAGSRLILRRGEALVELRAVAREVGADALCWNRRCEPAAVRQEARLRDGLGAAGIAVSEHTGEQLFEPGHLLNKAGAPYQVFSAFWRHCERLSDPQTPLPAPTQLPAPLQWPVSVSLEALELLPRIDWAAGLRQAWAPGEAGAAESLRRFVDGAVADYAGARDRPALPGVSRLSPHLHFGELSPRQAWYALVDRERAMGKLSAGQGPAAWQRQLGWREFARHLLLHFPHSPEQPLRARFARFPWVAHDDALGAWRRGQTGFPIVDAGMRELWHTGWMHNRARMIASSLLVKDLRIHWLEGARWFWDTLVDADLANNTLGWQWIAGCGADAAPYFRIFNPVRQGQRFDPDGSYVHRWVPELARLPARWIHQPWEAPAKVLAQAGVRLGRDYPAPLVDHAVAREQALQALRSL